MAQDSEQQWSLESLTDEDIERAQERITEAFDEAREWLAEDEPDE